MRGWAIWLLLLALSPGLARGAAEPDRAGAGITGPHDLQPGRTAAAATCGFCHTPEGAPGPAPRWARSASAAAFTAFDGRAADGGIRVSGPNSVVCLTCHDGVQAAEAVADMPLAAPMRGLGGLATGGHPVGIPLGADALAGSGGPDRPRRLQRATIGGAPSWWLDLEPVPNGVRDKTDAVLFTRGGDVAPEPYVECATCHDPHAAPGAMMLRNAETGSNLCLACHDR